MNYHNGKWKNGQTGHNGMHLADEIGEQHVATSIETPLRDDAFELSDEDKIDRIAGHFEEIMQLIGLDLDDDSLQGTPRRVAKMYVQEIFSGLNPVHKPEPTLFENKFNYRSMVVEKEILVQSFCEHHFLPIYGRAHVAYISSGKVIGLSKLNRIVAYYAKRPQVQERLTMQIANELKQVLETEDVAVYLEAKHMCVQARGIEHQDSSTVTFEYGGRFLNENTKQEFLQAIR
ncbi:MAG: GTP cyclohydrolase I FolE [Saprospirales bacterium]|nr:GTP cyclohydrolase I FolE [Saprospirales bacterium]MBK8492122.1 GTP cyclohydrolase I FolE [Saprospirales bacterium]